MLCPVPFSCSTWCRLVTAYVPTNKWSVPTDLSGALCVSALRLKLSMIVLSNYGEGKDCTDCAHGTKRWKCENRTWMHCAATYCNELMLIIDLLLFNVHVMKLHISGSSWTQEGTLGYLTMRWKIYYWSTRYYIKC